MWCWPWPQHDRGDLCGARDGVTLPEGSGDEGRQSRWREAEVGSLDCDRISGLGRSVAAVPFPGLVDDERFGAPVVPYAADGETVERREVGAAQGDAAGCRVEPEHAPHVQEHRGGRPGLR